MYRLDDLTEVEGLATIDSSTLICAELSIVRFQGGESHVPSKIGWSVPILLDLMIHLWNCLPVSIVRSLVVCEGLLIA